MRELVQTGVPTLLNTAFPSGVYVKKDGTTLYFLSYYGFVIWQLELPSKPLDLSGNVRVHGET